MTIGVCYYCQLYVILIALKNTLIVHCPVKNKDKIRLYTQHKNRLYFYGFIKESRMFAFVNYTGNWSVIPLKGKISSSQFGSVVRAWALGLKGSRFNSSQGHMTWLQAQSPTEAGAYSGGNQSMFFSLSLPLPRPLWKAMEKISLREDF